MGGLERHLRTLVVAGGRADAALGIPIDGQACDVEHAAPDALVGLSLTPHSQGEGVAHELVGIEAADTVAVGDAGEVDEIDEGVDLIEFLALQHTTDELLTGRTVARGVFATGFIHASRGGDA